jgi:CO/xanthine dehydrogenase Mo-binding subunit/DNA-binding CsgD family transcriptional regulator
VIAPDMGGSFGTGVFGEDALVPFLAKELRRPVRWVEDRQENLVATRHARDQVHELELAYDDDGRVLALRDRFLVDVGAYNAYAITVSYNSAAHLRGQYAIDCFSIEGLNVVTTKAPVTPVRGAGRPESVFALERALDLVAAERRLDPAEVRRRNLIAPEEMPRRMGMPYRDGAEMVYDSGDFPAQLEQALEAFGYGHAYEQARCHWRLAEALLSTGDREGARTHAEAAAAAATQLHALPLQRAVAETISSARLAPSGSGGDGGLTAREGEILALVAEGLTNREIGKRLFISDKTVSVHLSNAMAKLNASSRTEAVTVAQRRGLLDVIGPAPSA